MARAQSLLHTLGVVLHGALSSGKGPLGALGFELTTRNRYLRPCWLSTSAPSDEAVVKAEPAVAAANTDSLGDRSKGGGGRAGSNTQEDAASDVGFSVGFRRILSERRGVMGALEGVVHIQNTLNNIILTLTDQDGHVKTVTSAGVVGFRGSRKSQPVAAEKAAEELARRAVKLGYTSVAVRLKGAGSNKQYAVQSLAAGGLQITSLADVTPIPYNGCRPPKKRRV